MGGDSEAIERKLDTAAAEPSLEIVRAVADIEGREETELSSIWDCTDHILDGLFSDPPSSEARMIVEFNYEDYRVTVHQDGTAQFLESS